VTAPEAVTEAVPVTVTVTVTESGVIAICAGRAPRVAYVA
jgi:hypothetical protein